MDCSPKSTMLYTFEPESELYSSMSRKLIIFADFHDWDSANRTLYLLTVSLYFNSESQSNKRGHSVSLCFNEADLLFCQIVQSTNLENSEDSSPTCEVIVDLKKHALRESSFNMTRGVKILRGPPKIFKTPEGGLWKNSWARRGGGSKNLYTWKPTHDFIIQIGWFSTQQFNDLCNSAISRGLQI